MLRAMLAAILAIGLFSPIYADKFDDVRREADQAFQKMDHEVAELEAQRQAEFKIYVQKELVQLKLDLIQSGHDSTLTTRLVSVVSAFADSAIVNTKASAQYKFAAFADLIQNTRDRFLSNEDQKASATSAVLPAEGSTASGDVIGEEEVGNSPSPSTHFTLGQIFQAKDEANWAENIREVTHAEKKSGSRLFFWQKSEPVWPTKVGQVWTSNDGKVTFAVGVGKGMMGENVAELAARNTLARIGRESARVVSAELVGTTPVSYHDHGNGTVSCLMAVPTALLPKEVER